MEYCIVCKSNINDEANYGLLISKLGIKIHHHCVYLMTNLNQASSINHGIFGFSLKDIRMLLAAASKKKCHYCNEANATISCSNELCKKWYHLKCGLDNDCLFQFVNEFQSYCEEHHNILDVKKHNDSELCSICFREMKDYHPVRSIPNCCQGWSHVACLRKYAFSAGYYFKCIICHNAEYAEFVKWRGVFVPEKDAIWEHRSAYGYLECNYTKCDALQCNCKKGRDFVAKKGGWMFIACTVCGSSAIHQNCFLLGTNEYTCELCTNLLQQAKSNKLNRTYDGESVIYPIKELPNCYSQSMTKQQISFMNLAHSFRYGIGIFDDNERKNGLTNNINNRTNNNIVQMITNDKSPPNHHDNNNNEFTVTKCTAIKCICPSGRTYNNDVEWQFLKCELCDGNTLMHCKCFTGIVNCCENCHPSNLDVFLLKLLNYEAKPKERQRQRLRSISPIPVCSIGASSIININNNNVNRKKRKIDNNLSSTSILDKFYSDNNNNSNDDEIILNQHNELNNSFHSELYQERINLFLHDKNEYLCNDDDGGDGDTNRRRLIYDSKTNSYSEEPVLNGKYGMK